MTKQTICPFRWFLTEWTPCSRSCGLGTQKRKIICRRKKMDNWIIEDDSQCTEIKPIEKHVERRCNEIMCPHEYLPLQWSKVYFVCSCKVSKEHLTIIR